MQDDFIKSLMQLEGNVGVTSVFIIGQTRSAMDWLQVTPFSHKLLQSHKQLTRIYHQICFICLKNTHRVCGGRLLLLLFCFIYLVIIIIFKI